jgi:hypothetical protein
MEAKWPTCLGGLRRLQVISPLLQGRHRPLRTLPRPLQALERPPTAWLGCPRSRPGGRAMPTARRMIPGLHFRLYTPLASLEIAQVSRSGKIAISAPLYRGSRKIRHGQLIMSLVNVDCAGGQMAMYSTADPCANQSTNS